jgi:iron complex outermembrane receptor protein
MSISFFRVVLTAALSLTASKALAQDQLSEITFTKDADLTEVSIEQLLNVEVFTSSRFPQKTSEAPSRVTVVDAEAIEKYGYRTLRDILNSIPGLFSTNDRNYTYLGARGFGIPGDYNTRFLMLLDGKRVNDNIYDSFGVDYDGIVNVDLIQRVEYASGPGSAVYGANAFFGVINIITKNGDDVGGLQVSAEYGSENSRRARVTSGDTFDNGVDVMLSASAYKSDGADLYFSEFDDPATNNGVAQGLDYHQAQNLFAKLKYQDWGFSVAYNDRKKGIPTASYGQEFNTRPSETIDTMMLTTLTYNPIINKDSQVFSSLSSGRYEYEGDYIYDYEDPANPALTINRDESTGGWLNAEVRYQTTYFDHQRIIIGAEYQKNRKQDQENFDVDPFYSYLDDSRSSKTLGLYIQDEIRLSSQLILNAGIRNDNNSFDSGSGNKTKNITSPRVALIYSMQPETSLKLIYATAFRNPNAYELYYGSGLGYLPNPDLKPEEIETYEFDIEHYFNNNYKLSASIYSNDTTNLIGLNSDPVSGDIFFDNINEVVAKGVDIEAQYLANSSLMFRASYSYVDTENKNTNMQLTNSPKNMVKLNLASPVFNKNTQAGVELQYLSDRATLAAGKTGDYSITNLTLSSKQLDQRLMLSASIYNLFDKSYADPASQEHLQSSILQDGRNFRIKATYTF